MPYEVATEKFSGPLEKLLELIEQEELPVSEVSLAKVTDGFVAYLKEKGGVIDPLLLSDFLVVASRLLLIKSKTLIPNFELTPDEEREVKDLESRLEIYKTFAARGGAASAHILSVWQAPQSAHARPFLFSTSGVPLFFPGKNLSLTSIQDAVNRITKELNEIAPEPAKIKVAIITIEEKIKELMNRFMEAVASNFKSITQGKPRSEVIATFLAILHLLKKQEISVEQSEQFGDIMLKKKTDGS